MRKVENSGFLKHWLIFQARWLDYLTGEIEKRNQLECGKIIKTAEQYKKKNKRYGGLQHLCFYFSFKYKVESVGLSS